MPTAPKQPTEPVDAGVQYRLQHHAESLPELGCNQKYVRLSTPCPEPDPGRKMPLRLRLQQKQPGPGSGSASLVQHQPHPSNLLNQPKAEVQPERA